MKGPHDPLVSHLNGGKQRVQLNVYGTVIKAIGAQKREVKFDFDGMSKEVTSRSLSLVEGEARVPVNELIIRSESSHRKVCLYFCRCYSGFSSPALTFISFLSIA